MSVDAHLIYDSLLEPHNSAIGRPDLQICTALPVLLVGPNVSRSESDIGRMTFELLV